MDVDTVEALSEALLAYKVTVIFTSHDPYFMKRVATCIVEVRDGRVVNYRGDYEAYLYSVNKEIDDSEREQSATVASRSAPAKKPAGKPPQVEARPARRNPREVQKELTTLERNIARLDDLK